MKINKGESQQPYYPFKQGIEDNQALKEYSLIWSEKYIKDEHRNSFMALMKDPIIFFYDKKNQNIDFSQWFKNA